MALTVQAQVQPPPAYLIDRFREPIRRVALTWITLARYLPIELTSWYRPAPYNVAASGVSYSQHLVGAAIDGLSPGLTRAQLLPYVQRVASYYGVSAPASASETSGRSVHVQGLPYGLVQRLLTRDEPGLLETASTFVGPPRPVGI